MLEDDQISFRSASLMSDEVEDYSHQIAEMIGIKKDNFVEAGVSHIFKRVDLYLSLSIQFLIRYCPLNVFSGENYLGYWMWLR